VDSPLIFGLHTNADLTYRMREASEMLTTIVETQPKESGVGAGKSMDDIVKEMANDLMARMPLDFVEEEFRVKVSKLKGPPKLPEDQGRFRQPEAKQAPEVQGGSLAPLNIFLFQELQRLQGILSLVRANLRSLIMAIDGTVVMTADLLEDLHSVFDGRVPKRWTHDASGAEISWLMPNIGGWFTGLVERHEQLSMWLERDRRQMKSFWITGFMNAQGFLTAIRQEVTRQHKAQAWALDDVVTHTEVLSMDYERVQLKESPPDEGQNIHGLFIEGAFWKMKDQHLDESEAKKLHQAMPVIYITAMRADEMRSRFAGTAHGAASAWYSAAVYKYPRRTDAYFIFRLSLKTGEFPPHHWRLRGVCLVAQVD
jgi:dynein heavy chain